MGVARPQSLADTLTERQSNVLFGMLLVVTATQIFVRALRMPAGQEAH